MNKEDKLKKNMKISKTIRSITKDFTQGFSGSTLMGWARKYDEDGRPLNSDPNYQVGDVLISDKRYYFIRKEWLVKIYDEPTSYGQWDSSTPIDIIDLKPNYLNDV